MPAVNRFDEQPDDVGDPVAATEEGLRLGRTRTKRAAEHARQTFTVEKMVRRTMGVSQPGRMGKAP